MPTLAQVRDRINSWLLAGWPIVTTAQDNYFATHGRYWQGLLTHTDYPVQPDNGTFNDTIGDALDRTPTDVVEKWTDVISGISTPIPAAFKVDSYHGPDGSGYIVYAYVRWRGVVYTRAQNVGPETWRTANWHVFDEGDE